MKQLQGLFLSTFCLLAFFWAGGTASYAAEEKTVRIATLSDYPPYGFYKDNRGPPFSEVLVPPGSDADSFQGYSWDIVRESFHAQGYTIELVITHWARAMASVREGNVDLLYPTGMNTERLGYFSYSESPVNDAAFLVYVNQGTKIEWQGLASLDGMTIGMVRGYNFGDEWGEQEGISKYPLNSIEQGFRMLQRGRLDGFAGYETNWDYVLKEMGLQGQFDKLPEFGASREYVVGLKTNPDAERLLRDFDAGFQAIKESGDYQRIVARWR
ncbi:substrate-binding periplasmic protein [Halomonas chromatireducens]|uniref:Bacterial extracellular solute-binding protein n=1 Tax=Halomonas chromatireducens TaxID=507626 RepID=A0A109UN76_9GAMM|nr:transporter substrate-binding domain-containing protein [Halomonas chromatireducens]AMD02432.1 Bacterial extracellular solute-binding protein [Halomonas chromatireducens]